MAQRIKIMVVEDHPDYRDIVAMALSKEADIELLGQFGTAEQALRSLQTLATRQEPDLILLDLNLPGISGIEAIPFFLQTLPKGKIIVLTRSDREADVFSAITAGASGYLLKSANIDQLTHGIRQVIQGGLLLDPPIARYILNKVSLPAPKEKPLLSNRELEILNLLADGLAKKEIAPQLSISLHTVDNHIRHIYSKLQVQNAPAAISMAYKSGILPTHD